MIRTIQISSRTDIVLASASLVIVYGLLAVLSPPGAIHGLFIIPIMLAARIGVKAGLLAAVGSIGFQAVIQLASRGAIFLPGTGVYVLSTWGLFAIVGGFSGALFAYLNTLSRRAYQAEHRLAMEQEVLAEMSRIVSSSLDIEEVYERLADKVRVLIPADRIIVSLADVKAGLVTASYVFGRGAALRRDEVLPLAGTITDEVMKSKSGLICEGNEDELKSWFPTHAPGAYADFRSYITVPLFLNDEVYGALHLCSTRPNAYTGRHLALAERVADQIAGAISQAKLNSELELEVKQRESLAEIARIIGSSLAIEEVYDLFADEVCKLVPFDRLTISIPDDERRFNTISYLSGFEVGNLQVGSRVPLEGTLAQEALASRSSALLQGVDRRYLEDHMPSLLPAYDSGLRSFLAVPLLHHGDAAAVLQIRSKVESAFSQRHVELANMIGGLVTGPVANVRLYADLDRAEKRATVLRDIFELSLQDMERDDLLRQLLDRAVGAQGADGGVIYLLDPDGQQLVPVASRLPVEWGFKPRSYAPGYGFTGRVMLKGVPEVIDDVANSSLVANPFIRASGVQTIISVPLKLRGETTGTLNLFHLQPCQVSSEELRFLEVMAGRSAEVIDRSRLLDELDQANRDLERAATRRRALTNISELSFDEMSFDDLVRDLLKHVVEAMGVDAGYICLFDRDQGLPVSLASVGFESGDFQAGEVMERQGFMAKVLEDKAPVVISDIADDALIAETRLSELGLRSLACVPLRAPGEAAGTLTIHSWVTWVPSEEQLSFLGLMADRVTQVIDRARLVDQLTDANRELVSELAERKQLEQQLLQAQKMEAVGRLAGGIAHDFNNLMTPVLSYTQLGADLTSEGSQLGKYLHEIHKAGERAAQLTRQLLAFSRRQVPERKIIDLNDLIMNIDEMLRRLIGENIELVFLPTEGPRTVNVDPGQIEQVLINLVVNARDAMPGGGRIVVTTDNITLEDAHVRFNVDAKPGEYVMFSVTDNGTGIAKENIEHIFEPFFTTKNVGTGTGLGLSTSYGTVSRIGGFITVESEPGQGATFNVHLPATNGVPSAEGDRTFRDDLVACDETILVVEDELSVLKVACELLRVQGYKVLEATNGHDALRRARDPTLEHIDLMLTDMVMPLMGGVELAGQMGEIRPETRVLFTSGYTGEQLADTGEQARDVVFLPKPYTPDSLLGRVREMLDE